MSLYDDDDLGALPKTEVAVGWSTGVKLMQSQLQVKKPKSMASMGPPVSNSQSLMPNLKKPRSSAPILAPVIDLKTKKPLEETSSPKSSYNKSERTPISKSISSSQIGIQSFNEPNFVVVNEYDPLWPNDYQKVIQEMRGNESKDGDENSDSKKRRYTEEGRAKARERYNRDDRDRDRSSSSTSAASEPSGFGRRPRGQDDYSDDSDDEDRRRKSARRSTGSTSGGAAIAPPPSLTETSNTSSSPTPPTSSALGTSPMVDKGPSSTGLGVAAKIMAKYGYKQGQGLGRDEQGMSQALSVEKTSKRGGRIVHEKDLMPPPMFGESFKTPKDIEKTPPNVSDTDEYGDPILHPSLTGNMDSTNQDDEDSQNKPSITELMKNPSKVVLCKNMVGPGEVDDDLEPEIKEECNGKYGDVSKVMIYEIPNATPEEAVRIFVEFKRVESAIKAVVDLNGRFFGGREVRASFYDVEKFRNLNLSE